MTITPATLLADRYRLGDLLGRGGMAEVYDGWDERLRRPVAVKLLRPEMAAQPEVRRRFEVEGRAAAQLSHPNVVAVFDTGEHDGEPFLVMERLPGDTLADRLVDAPLSSEEVERLAREVLGALGAAHSAGIVHRDIKPANILMAPNGSAKLADFGIAKSAELMAGDPTTAGVLFGTPAYLAPERVDGLAATARSDLYAVGVVLYEVLAGRKPFQAPTPLAMAAAIQTGTPPPLGEVCPRAAPGLVAAVESAMARDPADRPATAAAMALLLDRTDVDVTSAMALPVAGLSDQTAVLPIGAPPQPGGQVGGRRLWVLVAAVLVVALLAATALAGGGDGGGVDEPDTGPGPVTSITAPTTVPTTLATPPTAVGGGGEGSPPGRRGKKGD
ncbi:MAG: serine/threonine-protein kinase [Acidimicrobiales bacterium]